MRKIQKSGVYTITNIINNRIYVGFASNMMKRKGQHFAKLRKRIHENERLQNSFNKYGEENFVFDVIERCEIEFLDSLEHYWAYWLDTHNPEIGFNIKPTHPYGREIMIQETKNKISVKAKGHKRNTPQQRKAIKESISKSVVLINITSNTEYCFTCLMDAARFISLPDQRIRTIAVYIGNYLLGKSIKNTINNFKIKIR